MDKIQYLVDNPTEPPIVDRQRLNELLWEKYNVSVSNVFSNDGLTIYHFDKNFGGAVAKVIGASEVRTVILEGDKEHLDKIKNTLESVLGKKLKDGEPVR